jgi:hypothetical protein
LKLGDLTDASLTPELMFKLAEVTDDDSLVLQVVEKVASGSEDTVVEMINALRGSLKQRQFTWVIYADIEVKLKELSASVDELVVDQTSSFSLSANSANDAFRLRSAGHVDLCYSRAQHPPNVSGSVSLLFEANPTDITAPLKDMVFPADPTGNDALEERLSGARRLMCFLHPSVTQSIDRSGSIVAHPIADWVGTIRGYEDVARTHGLPTILATRDFITGRLLEPGDSMMASTTLQFIDIRGKPFIEKQDTVWNTPYRLFLIRSSNIVVTAPTLLNNSGVPVLAT